MIQPSELLYLIISTANYGGAPALELFRPSEIADPDGDGLLEFIDAWGKPIQWIRWPAGYPSDLNRYANTDALDPLELIGGSRTRITSSRIVLKLSFH